MFGKGKAVFVAALCLAMGACKPPPIEGESQLDALGGVEEEELAAPEYNIGDVEIALHVQALLAAESQTTTVTTEEMLNRFDEVSMLTVTVAPPYPEHLWFEYTLLDERELHGRTAYLRGKVMRDMKDDLGSLAGLLPANDSNTDCSVRVDALAGLDSAPETLGLNVSGELLLFPEGTDEATLDPDTAVPVETSGSISQTVVRVNFVAEAAADDGPADEAVHVHSAEETHPEGP